MVASLCGVLDGQFGASCVVKQDICCDQFRFILDFLLSVSTDKCRGEDLMDHRRSD